MKVVPLNDKLVVKRLEAESKTAGGIVLPDNAKEKPRQGKVLSLGDGKLLDSGSRGYIWRTSRSTSNPVIRGMCISVSTT